MSINEKMTAVADGIRALSGNTAALSLDGMKTDLATLKTNVTSALNAIKAKGVTVSSSAKLKNLAALINSIEAGGDATELFGYELATGTITPSEDIMGTYTITTDIKCSADTPQGDILIHFLDTAPTTASSRTYRQGWLAKIYVRNVLATSANFKNEGVGYYYNTSGAKAHVVSESQLGQFSVNSSGYIEIELWGTSNYGFLAGERYRWILIRRGIGE